MSQAKINLKITGVRGGSPSWNPNKGRVTTFVDNDDNFISVDAFDGVDKDYKRREQSEVEVCVGKKHWCGSIKELIEKLIPNKEEKKNFSKQINSVVHDAIEFIKQKAKKSTIVLFKGSEEDEAFLDLPTVTSVSKHNFYEQFAVLSIEKIKSDIILHTKSRGDDSSLKDFKLEELSSEDAASICQIADLVSNL